MNKQEALEKIQELKTFVEECDKKEVSKIKIQIKNRFTGSIIFESTKDTIKEAVVDAKNSGADLRYADLRGADLSGASLSDVNLRGADLRGADLRYADLRGADLSGASLSDVNLRGASLSDVNLRYADLRCADLSDADLRGANLSGADLQNVKFYGLGGDVKIMKKDLLGFLGALGFKLEE